MIFHPRDPSYRAARRRDFLRRVRRDRRRPARARPRSSPRAAATGRERLATATARRSSLRYAGEPGDPPDLRRHPADRLRPRARGRARSSSTTGRTTSGRTSRSRTSGGVRRRGQGRDLLQHGGGDPEDPDGTGRRSTSSSRRRRTCPKMVAAKLVQPLNHDYLPNLDEHLADAPRPVLRQGSQYSVPYAVYHTGIGWRTDLLPFELEELAVAPTRTSLLGRRLPGRGRASTTCTGTRSRSGCTAPTLTQPT